MKAVPARIDCDDLLTRRGSELLADAINAYWRERGFRNVNATPYPIRGDNAWGVRSDLWNGFPRGAQKKAQADRALTESRRKPPIMTDEDRALAARRAEFLR